MFTNRMRDIAKMDGRVNLYLMHPLGEPDIIEVVENRYAASFVYFFPKYNIVLT
jgi:hypothetical protein